MKGELIHVTVFDVGAEVDLARVGRLLGCEPRPAPLVSRSPSPPYAAFAAPLEVRPGLERFGGAPEGTTVEVRLHTIGALAVRLRVPFVVDRLEDIFAIQAKSRVGTMTLEDAARQIGEAARREVGGARLDPYDVIVEPETYTVYCLTADIPPASDILSQERELLAALASGESAPGLLADAQVETALRHTVRYYKSDAVVVGWDDAVIIGLPDTYEDVVDVMELANLELLEFRTYDTYIDRKLDEAFVTLDRLWAPGGLFRSARGVLQDISEVRADFARLTDNLHDTGKMFGDWYLAKVHQRLRDRFHLAEWERGVAAKMETLEDMFQLAEEETNHRRALTLELMIVLLFVVDLALLWLVSK